MTIIDSAESLNGKVAVFMDRLEYNKALSAVWEVIGSANRYIDESAPWALAKDFSKRERLAAVLYNSAEVLRIITLYIYPYMPEAAKEIWRQLGIEDDIEAVSLDSACKWNGLKSGLRVKKGSVLFPRIDTEIKSEGSKTMDEIKETAVEKPVVSDTISIEDFAKITLRVGKIISAENVPNSKKLIKLLVDIGDEQRQLVAGIALHYKPEEIVGRSVVIV